MNDKPGWQPDPADPTQAASSYGQQPYGQQSYGAPQQPGYGAPGAPYQPGMPPPQKSGGGKTAIIVIAVVVVAILAVCGGLIGLIVWAGSSFESAIKSSDREGGPDNPIAVELGEEFEIDGFEIESGWSVGPDPDYSSLEYQTILDVKATNDGDTAENLYIDFTFVSEDEEIAEVSCSTDGDVQPGRSETLDCHSSNNAIEGYDEINVNASF